MLAAVTQPQMISARRNEWVSTIKPVMIGAKEAQMKLAEFLVPDAVIERSNCDVDQSQQDVPAK